MDNEVLAEEAKKFVWNNIIFYSLGLWLDENIKELGKNDPTVYFIRELILDKISKLVNDINKENLEDFLRIVNITNIFTTDELPFRYATLILATSVIKPDSNPTDDIVTHEKYYYCLSTIRITTIMLINLLKEVKEIKGQKSAIIKTYIKSINMLIDSEENRFNKNVDINIEKIKKYSSLLQLCHNKIRYNNYQLLKKEEIDAIFRTKYTMEFIINFAQRVVS